MKWQEERCDARISLFFHIFLAGGFDKEIQVWYTGRWLFLRIFRWYRSKKCDGMQKEEVKMQKAEPGKANVRSHAGDLLKIDTDREADYQYPSDRLITGWKNWINMNTTSSWRK